MERKYWRPEVEELSLEELQKIQLPKVQKQIKYCYDNSPFYYRKKLDEIGIKPEDIRTWEDFRNIPILLTKEDERKSQEGSIEMFGHPYGLHVCAPVEKVQGITATSGTTGTPTFTHLFTAKDLSINNEVWARVFWRAGMRPGDLVMHAFGFSMWTLGVPCVMSIINFGARPIPVGAEAGSERILRFLDQCRPSAMVATAPLVEHLIERAPGLIDKPVGELGLKRIVCTGAPGAGIPQVRKKIETSYGASLWDSAGGGEGVHMVSCDAPEYQGMHFVSPEYAIWSLDLVDPETKKPLEIKNGVIGEGIMTSLEHEARPPLKFAFGDMLQVFTDQCVCGSKAHRVRILSRVDDMLIIKGVNVFPTAVRDVIAGFAPRTTGEMRIVLDEPGPGINPPLQMRVERGYDSDEGVAEDLKRDLEEALHNRMRFRSVIEIIPPNTLERAAGPNAKGILIERRYLRK